MAAPMIDPVLSTYLNSCSLLIGVIGEEVCGLHDPFGVREREGIVTLLIQIDVCKEKWKTSFSGHLVPFTAFPSFLSL